MKIVIDARLYGLENAGLGRYVTNLIDHIEKIDKKNNYFIFLRQKYFKTLEFKNPNFHKVLADYHHYSLKEQVLLPLQLIKLRPSLVHFPHFNVAALWWGRQVVTIHDLIMHESKGPEATTRWRPFYWLKYFVYQGLIWLAIKRAAQIIVPSYYWKNEIFRRYRISSEKIVVTYEAVDRKFQRPQKMDREVIDKYKIKKPFIVYTGNLYPHKNVEKLVEALSCYHILKQENQKLSLVIVCSRSVFYQWFLEKVEKMGAESFVNLVGFVPDEDLGAIYQKAEAFVLPTLIEGFGLIGLEAMALGCPVLASNIPVLKEVYGQAALYFDPHSNSDIAKKIGEMMGNRLRRHRLIEAGFKQVKKYSWQKMASETLKVYREAVGKGN